MALRLVCDFPVRVLLKLISKTTDDCYVLKSLRHVWRGKHWMRVQRENVVFKISGVVCSGPKSLPIGPLHDPVAWYKITHAGEQVAQRDFQNKGRCRWTGTSCIVLEAPLCNLLTSMRDFVPCDGSCKGPIEVLHGRDKRFFFLWEKKFFLMQNICIVPAMQHGGRAKSLLA